jgi:hypothetical protein
MTFKENNDIFGVGTYIEKSLCAFFIGELYLFKRLFVTFVACVDPLVWWCNHETQFPNIDLFAK